MIEFTKQEGATPQGPRVPQTWCVLPWPTGGNVVEATCPKGHTGTVAAKVHAIADDGTMTPSYVCPIKGCDFHDWARFLGWAPVPDRRPW